MPQTQITTARQVGQIYTKYSKQENKMATRYPLVIDIEDNNKIKEIPLGDDLNLSGSSLVNAVNITSTGTLSGNALVIDSSTVTIGGQSLHSTAFTGNYNSLTNLPTLFSGSYVDLTNKPTLKTTIESLDNVGSTPPTNGQVLIYNSSLGRYEPGDQTGGGGGGGAGITIQDEGANLTSSGTILNFVGPGVTATGNGATKTITITSGTGIALDSLSVGSPASASGSGSISYNNSTGVFTYTPPDLSSYLTSYTETDPVVGAITGIVKADGAGNISAAVAGTDYLASVAFSDLTSTPTTIAGYGITDAVEDFADLGTTPTTISGYGITDAFDGAFSSLTSKPTTIAGYGITDAVADFADLGTTPTTLAGYGITDALSSGGNITLGGDLDVGGNSIVSASNGPINIAPNGTGAIELNGQVKFAEGMIEKFATTNGATGVTALDCSTGNVHYLTAPAGDITANFTNLNLTAEYATNVTVIIDQGNTEYEITAVQIGGAAQTIVWQGNSAPTGTANGVDSFSFTILNDGGTYVVLGQMVAFGGV